MNWADAKEIGAALAATIKHDVQGRVVLLIDVPGTNYNEREAILRALRRELENRGAVVHHHRALLHAAHHLARHQLGRGGAGDQHRADHQIGFVSLGCPKALTDSELILTQLSAEGYAERISELEAAAARRAAAASASVAAERTRAAAFGHDGGARAIQLRGRPAQRRPFRPDRQTVARCQSKFGWQCERPCRHRTTACAGQY